MGYYLQITEDLENQAQREARIFHETHQGSMTNMKRTLLQDIPSFKVYMAWYDLREGLLAFVTAREFSLFSYAISTTNDCLVCSTFFRRILIDEGDDPDHLVLTSTEQLLWDLGQAIVLDSAHVNESIYERLNQRFNQKEVIQLMAFAGQMIATNEFVSMAKVDLDVVLYSYQKERKNG